MGTCVQMTSGSSSTRLPNVSRPWKRGCCVSSRCWSAASSGDRCGRCTRWPTAGSLERYTNTGHGYGESGSGWPPRRMGGERVPGHRRHLAPPRRFDGFQVVVRVLVLAWVFIYVVFRELAAPTAGTMVAECGFFCFLVSVRELVAPTAGYFGCVLCILVSVVLFWGRQGSSWLCLGSGVLGARGLASPGPNLGAKARLFASSLCRWVSSFSESFFFG